MKSKFIVITIFAALLLIFGLQAGFACDYECTFDCRSPGFWKNHPEAWPVEAIWIGGTMYTKEDAIANMQTPTQGDKWYTMFRALVAAKLNVIKGCKCCKALYCIKRADGWMEDVGDDEPVPANSDAWQCDGEKLYRCLDSFNNGGLCYD